MDINHIILKKFPYESYVFGYFIVYKKEREKKKFSQQSYESVKKKKNIYISLLFMFNYKL